MATVYLINTHVATRDLTSVYKNNGQFMLAVLATYGASFLTRQQRQLIIYENES